LRREPNSPLHRGGDELIDLARRKDGVAREAGGENMTKRAVKPRSKSKRVAIPREVRAAYGEIQQGLAHLDESVVDLRAGLRRAEQKIEADARRRITDLRREARKELKVLQARQREAARTLKKLSVAAGQSWRDVKRSADAIFADARGTAAAVAQRFRAALRG
jgi:hypothetical protein